MDKPGSPVAWDNQENITGQPNWEHWLTSGQLYFSGKKTMRYNSRLYQTSRKLGI